MIACTQKIRFHLESLSSLDSITKHVHSVPSAIAIRWSSVKGFITLLFSDSKPLESRTIYAWRILDNLELIDQNEYHLYPENPNKLYFHNLEQVIDFYLSIRDSKFSSNAKCCHSTTENDICLSKLSLKAKHYQLEPTPYVCQNDDIYD